MATSGHRRFDVVPNNPRGIGGRWDTPIPVSGTPTGGGGGDMLEARVAKLEAHAEHMREDIGEIKSDVKELAKDAKADFRILFGAIVFVALGLAGLMAKGFKWL